METMEELIFGHQSWWLKLTEMCVRYRVKSDICQPAADLWAKKQKRSQCQCCSRLLAYLLQIALAHSTQWTLHDFKISFSLPIFVPPGLALPLYDLTFTRGVGNGCQYTRWPSDQLQNINYFTSCDPHHDIHPFCYLQIFWHSIWHISWHSIWHSIWLQHNIMFSYNAGMVWWCCLENIQKQSLD